MNKKNKYQQLPGYNWEVLRRKIHSGSRTGTLGNHGGGRAELEECPCRAV